MRTPSRIALNLGLAALLGMAGGSATTRADEPEDLETTIRAFEDEKRAELDGAIAEVAAAVAEQRQELERVQASVARSEVALARLQAMKRALDSLDASPSQPTAEPMPIGHAMPPLPTRTTPASEVLTSGEAPRSSCCSAPTAPRSPTAVWEPGAATARNVGVGVRFLTLPDGTLRAVPPEWTGAPEPTPTARPVTTASDIAPVADETMSSADQARLIALLRDVIDRLDAIEDAEVVPPPPASAVVRPSPSSIVPTP